MNLLDALLHGRSLKVGLEGVSSSQSSRGEEVRPTGTLEHETQAVGIIGSLQGDDVVVLGALEDLGERGQLEGEGEDEMKSVAKRMAGGGGRRGWGTTRRTLIPKGMLRSHR